MDFIKTYFQAEKSASLLFIAIGVLAITFSVYAVIKRSAPFYKGFAIPGILIGLIQLAVGSTVYFRSDKQQASLERLYEKSQEDFITVEINRMNQVMDNFVIVKKLEILFIVIGLLFILLFQSKEFWLGIGVGLFMQGAIMLTCDIFADRRGKIYQAAFTSEA